MRPANCSAGPVARAHRGIVLPMLRHVLWWSLELALGDLGISMHFFQPYLGVSCRSSCALCIWASEFDLAVYLNKFFFYTCSSILLDVSVRLTWEIWCRACITFLHSIKERDFVLIWRLRLFILLTWFTRQRPTLLKKCMYFAPLSCIVRYIPHWLLLRIYETVPSCLLTSRPLLTA